MRRVLLGRVSDGTAAPAPSSDLLNEQFETGAVDWTFSNAPDPNGTPAIVGAKSLRLNAASQEAYKAFTPQAVCGVFFRYRFDTVAGSGHAATFGLLDEPITTIVAGMRVQDVGGGAQEVKLSINGALSSASTITLTQGVEYYVWHDYDKTGTVALAISSTGVKPSVDGSGAVYLTGAGPNLNAGYPYFVTGSSSPGDHFVDNVIVRTAPIGDNP